MREVTELRLIENPKLGDLAIIEVPMHDVRLKIPVVVKHVGPLKLIVETWSFPTQLSVKSTEVWVGNDEKNHNSKGA